MKMIMFISVAMSLLALTHVQGESPQKESGASQRAEGSFDVKIGSLAAYNQEDKTLGRFSIDKQFHGDLEATSKGEMLSAGNPGGPGGYVAIEKVTGALRGRSGSFVLQHSGTMEEGKPHMNIIVVPGSGTGELAGIRGRLDIVIDKGKHSYVFEYTL